MRNEEWEWQASRRKFLPDLFILIQQMPSIIKGIRKDSTIHS